MSTRILTLDEVPGLPVGGKAEGLARLEAMGLRVPATLVLMDASPDRLPSDLDTRVSALGQGRLAVRSSAIGEDGEGASFAGQYETILNVEGPDALRAAIAACVESVESDRATAYRDERDGESEAVSMSIVVQRMVDARASGVCFTVDPVTHRHNRLVLDSVAGLGEALVSGEASPDHDEFLRAQGIWEETELAGDAPCLTSSQRSLIAREALEAERLFGAPLDLEWAIDADGTLYWLQARPITTLGHDPQTLDAVTGEEGDVFTRCNVGEMMPGAISPLTFSTCARGIDVGWQNNLRAVGVRRDVSADNVYIGMTHGHLFINLSEGARFSSAVMGSSPDQQSLAICGRLVPEVTAPAPPSILVRLPRILRQLLMVVRPKPRLRRMETLLARGPIATGVTSAESWRAIDARRDDLNESYALHLTVSSGAGALSPIILGRLAGDDEPTDEHHAIVAHLLAGAENVESADIAEGAERVLDALWSRPDRSEAFVELDVPDAVAWLESAASGEAGVQWRGYLERHGHRSLRELDIRQPEWAHDPTPLVRSLQTQVRGRMAGSEPIEARKAPAPPAGVERFDRIQGIAHAAVRNRERGKSLLVGLTMLFKKAYRQLGAQLVSEGRLPDADAIYFLFHEEIGALADAAPGSPLADVAVARRIAFDYQKTLVFPEVAVGLPQPERSRPVDPDGRTVIGKPVSRGQIEGLVRVVMTLEEAEQLEPGEILVAPITDVGWTPYFAIIGGLVTDVGSAVSHGAVVAREYGLPAVLNTQVATRVLQTGERVRLDADRGIVERLD